MAKNILLEEVIKYEDIGKAIKKGCVDIQILYIDQLEAEIQYLKAKITALKANRGLPLR